MTALLPVANLTSLLIGTAVGGFAVLRVVEWLIVRSTSTPPRFWWFSGASVIELAERIQLIGPDKARLEVRIVGEKMYLQTVGAGYHGPPINESHICPGDPACP